MKTYSEMPLVKLLNSDTLIPVWSNAVLEFVPTENDEQEVKFKLSDVKEKHVNNEIAAKCPKKKKFDSEIGRQYEIRLYCWRTLLCLITQTQQ